MEMISRRILTLALLAGFAGVAEAQVEALREFSKPGNEMNLGMYGNPALMYCRYMHTLNTLQLGTDYADESKARLMETGSGLFEGKVEIDAYVRKTPKTTIWGSARYSNGQQRSVLFSETSDYATVYPYIMADTVGGDVHRETYAFVGGFAHKTGRWTLGAVGEYRALLASRTVDPRPKNLTGDLKATFGATYDLIGAWRAGLAVNARKYKQTNEVKIYSEVTSPTIYHATGLGHDYYRFRGDYGNTYYKGHGVGGLLTFSNDRCPKDNMYEAVVGFDYTKVEKIITSLNELPLAESNDYVQTAELAKSLNDDNGWGVALSERYHCRQGRENVFGDAIAGEYPLISSAPGYRQTDFTMGLRGYGQWALEGSSDAGRFTQLGFNASAALTRQKEQYQSSEAMENSCLALEVAPKLVVLNKDARFAGVTLSGVVGYDVSFDNHLNLAKNQVLNVATTSYYDYLSSNRFRLALSAKADFKLVDKALLFVSVGGSLCNYAEKEHAHECHVSLGMEF